MRFEVPNRIVIVESKSRSEFNYDAIRIPTAYSSRRPLFRYIIDLFRYIIDLFRYIIDYNRSIFDILKIKIDLFDILLIKRLISIDQMSII